MTYPLAPCPTRPRLLSGWLFDLEGIPLAAAGAGRVDLDRPDPALGRRPRQIHVQEPIVERSPQHLQALGEDEAALELPRGNAAVEKDPALVVFGLTAANDELSILDLIADYYDFDLLGFVDDTVTDVADALAEEVEYEIEFQVGWECSAW